MKIFVMFYKQKNNEFYMDSNKIHFVVILYYIDEMLLKRL